MFSCVGHVPFWVIMFVCFKQGNGWNKKWLIEGYNIVTHVPWAQIQLWHICLLPMSVASASGWVYLNIPVKTPLKSQVLQNQGVQNQGDNRAFHTGSLLDYMCLAIGEWQINTLRTLLCLAHWSWQPWSKAWFQYAFDALKNKFLESQNKKKINRKKQRWILSKLSVFY